MKKLASLFLLIFSLCLLACNNKKEYKLIINDDFDILISELDEYYSEGVTLQLKVKVDEYYKTGIIVNDEVLVAKESTDDYNLFEYTFSNHDVTIFTTRNGYIYKKCKEPHEFDEGVIIDVPGGGQELLYTCKKCGERKSEDIKVSKEITDFSAQYIRTGYKKIVNEYTIIGYKAGLESYYKNNKDYYDLERKEITSAIDSTIGFLDVCDKYDIEFFKEKSLIIIPLIETSGSILHTVESLSIVNDTLKINIKSNIPYVCTDDMAGWHIIVEVNSSDIKNIDRVEIYKDDVLINPSLKIRQLSDWYPFLDNIKVDEIKEVQFINSMGSVAPGVLQNTEFSQDKEDIKKVLEYLKNAKLEITSFTDLEKVTTGEGTNYYNIITSDKTYKVYLSKFLFRNNEWYKLDFEKVELDNVVYANNILCYNENFEVRYNLSKVLEIDFVDELMFKEYDNGNEYYMSDGLTILEDSLGSILIRIIDKNHFQYDNKYYEILGVKNFDEILNKVAFSSLLLKNNIITIVDLSTNEVLAKVTYRHGQSLLASDIITILGNDTISKKALYLDNECKQLLGESVEVSNDLTIYLTDAISKKDVYFGLYGFFKSSLNPCPSFTLYNDNKFIFTFNGLSSYIGYGTYEVVDEYLYLKESVDYYWVFKIEDSYSLIYDEEMSKASNHMGDFTHGSEFVYIETNDGALK